jgi:hypothetical protein
LIRIDMDMGIKGSNNEPRAQINWREKERANGLCAAR